MNKPSNSIIINICIIPNEATSKSCVLLSQSLKSDDTVLFLGDGKFAHMTVYMARFAKSNVENVISATKNALKNIKPFDCKHTGYFLTAGRYLEVSYEKSDQFMELQNALIDNIAKFRINPGNPYEEGYFTPYNADQRRNAEETGYDLAYDLYRPHITLTRYKEGHTPELSPSLPKSDLSFQLSTICVYLADDNGAVYEKLVEFRV